MEQSLMEKLTILADSAKYDVACTSSGASRAAKAGSVGSCYAPGCCHAFTADGRCVSLLKVLMTNCCAFDCSYCVNRRSNDAPRATFSPWELAELTIEFYRRNYIEGLFLSSAVLGTPDYTTERMLAVLRLLRGEYRFGGYIHAKAIPGTSPELLQQLGYLADRLSVNVELPSERSLNLLAPDKGRHSIFSHEADRGVRRRQPGGAYSLPPRAQVRPRRAEHPDDRGCFAGDGLPHLKADRGNVPEIRAEAGVLLRLHPGSRGPLPACAGHKAAPSAGAPTVSGRLAAAVLWV